MKKNEVLGKQIEDLWAQRQMLEERIRQKQKQLDQFNQQQEMKLLLDLGRCLKKMGIEINESNISKIQNLAECIAPGDDNTDNNVASDVNIQVPVICPDDENNKPGNDNAGSNDSSDANSILPAISTDEEKSMLSDNDAGSDDSNSGTKKNEETKDGYKIPTWLPENDDKEHTGDNNIDS